MKKIKILQTIRQGKIGGGESHVLEVCKQINKDLFEPVVLAFTNGNMIEQLNNLGVRTKVIYTERPFDIRVWKKVKRFMAKEQFDMVHAHGTRAMSNVFWATRSLQIPLIYTVHGWSFHPDQKLMVRKLREMSEKFLTQQATRTLCVSKSNQADGVQRFNMQRSQVIYNAVDINRFSKKTSTRTVREELNIPEDKAVIGYIARITEQKDPFTMLKAMAKVVKKLPNTVLLIVGEGNLHAQTKLLAQQLGIQDQVIFESFRTDIPQVLQAIDVYCLPSLWEGFPIGILEAMAMKVPVIASPVDGTRELVDDGHTGLLVNNKAPNKLADALCLLLRNKDLGEKLASKAQDFVHTNFSAKEQIERIQKVYSSCLASTEQAFA